MLSAVESFSPASGAASNPYAHPSHFSIAAAAAAAGSAAAAAAAAAVVPQCRNHNSFSNSSHCFSFHQYSHHLHQKQQQQQQHIHQNLRSIQNETSETQLENLSCHLSETAFFQPSPSGSNNNIELPSIFPLTSSSQDHQEETSQSSLSSKKLDSQMEVDDSNAMSSTEFVKPFPKQPRYEVGLNSCDSATDTSSINFAKCPIPPHLRSPLTSSMRTAARSPSESPTNTINKKDKALSLNKNCKNTTGSISGANNPTITGSNYTNENPGPVNLVTSNSGNSSSYSHSRDTGTPTELTSISRSNSTSSAPISMFIGHGVRDISSMSQMKNTSNNAMPEAVMGLRLGDNSAKLPYPSQPIDTNVVQSSTAAAVAAAAYQYNYPQLYANSSLYGATSFYTGHHNLNSHNTVRPSASYLNGPATQSQQQQLESFPSYLQAAVAAAASGIYTSSHTSLSQVQAPQMIMNSSGSMIALGPPPLPLKNVSIVQNEDHSKKSKQTGRCSSDRSEQHPPLPVKDANNFNGTFLNGKVNNSPAKPESVSGFKVPVGKEGSLKHRILTRPSHLPAPSSCISTAAQSSTDSNRKVETRPSMATTVVRSSSTSNFMKGACIELGNGVLRRVEDMRTEDFIQSAERSPYHQLAESTVVKMHSAANSVIITFSYDKNRPKADVEVPLEHPFFVYGQGWASCKPDLSFKAFGLKCQRLQVGDICISLILREDTVAETPISASLMNSSKCISKSSNPQIYFNPSENRHILHLQSIHASKNYASATLPQNLSRKIFHPPQKLQQQHCLDDCVNLPPPKNLAAVAADPSITQPPAISRSTADYTVSKNYPLHFMSAHIQQQNSQPRSYANMVEIVAAYENATNGQISRANTSETFSLSHRTHKNLSTSSSNNFYHQHPLYQLQYAMDRSTGTLPNSDFHLALPTIGENMSNYPRIPPQSMSEPISIHSTQPNSSFNNRSHYPSLLNDGKLSSQQSQCNESDTDQPIDASLSRKRRWSAPESIFDEDHIKLQSKDSQSSQPMSIPARLF